MNVYITKVKKQEKEILFRLLQYSLFEESENDLNEMNDNAIFEYEFFDNYFNNKSYNAYFIKEEKTDKLLGFVMVNTYVQTCKNGHSIAEFLVIPKYRRNKIGRNIAYEIFDKYPGVWEVSPSYNSEKAYSFWKKTIEEYTNYNCKYENGLFIFNNSKLK